MSSIIEAILACLCGIGPATDGSDNEKQALIAKDTRTAEEVAGELVHAILEAKKSDRALSKELNDIVGDYGWTERVAEWTLNKLKPVLKEALDKTWEVAKEIEGFVQEHPVMCTVIALGVLVMVAPWAIEALGFGELGPVEGSYAALWQSRYAGYVPKGSLFSFFQRLGMTWH
ncbi:hypothetical protein BDV96DRAFT_630885 [Lophiotrema nucula]|uniref:Uncharacterized protein n=1 Tax=Lophiotrema nucula TaxID=690887 RepID=A0A6A5ZDI7_9PLEO|nr:hypothetical protein BDV96DRAFT_630885 [Lophiotrema nucula]